MFERRALVRLSRFRPTKSAAVGNRYIGSVVVGTALTES
jgi:hypothetical protein